MSDLNFDTRTSQPYSNAQSWGNDGSPSSASGYQGCSIGADNHSYIFRRQGFPCGTYQLNLPSHDDMAILLVDGIEVWRNYGCCATRTAVWTGYLGSTSTVELRVSEGGGGSHGALEFVSLPISATVTGTNPTTCGGNGSITMSNVQNGHRSVFQSDFSITPAGTSLSGVAGISGGELTLTPAAANQLGSVVLTPSYRANAWTANYSQFIGGGSGADGMSFTYGPISGAGGGDAGWASGLVVSFDTYNGATNSQLNIYWNGGIIWQSAVNVQNFRSGNYVPVKVSVNTSNQLSVSWNSIDLLTNYGLPAGYISADKSAWNYGFSARTGGLNDAHKVSDLYISSIAFLEYSTNGSTWSTTNPILAPAGSYTVQARPVGISCPNANIGTVTLTNPNTIDWANLQSPATATICTTGSATLYGRVYKNGYTNIANADANMTVQVGYSLSNTNPNTWAAGAWSAATFNVQTGTSGNDDEYQATLSGLAAGTYYYTFRYKYCSDGAWYYGGYNPSSGGFWDGTSNISGVLTVNQPSVAPTSISGTTTICNSSSTTLTAFGGSLGTGAVYEWGTGSIVGTNPIAGQSGVSISVSPTATTTYWVRIINSAAPCATTTSGVSTTVIVNQPSVAPTSITGTTTICNANSTTLTASGGTLGTNAVYEWGTGSTVGLNPIAGQSGVSISVSPSSTTTYWVRIINGAAPCSATTAGVSTAVTINQPSVNPSSISGSALCVGESGTLTAIGGSLGAGANYQWGTGSVVGTNPISGATNSTLSVSPTSSTNYWVQIVNGTGPCSATTAGLSTLVTVNTPTFTATPTAGSVVWRGTSSTDWTAATNWYAYNGTSYSVATATPTSTSNVIIPANQGCVAQQPTVISGTVSAKDVVIETGANLTMTTGTLNVDGNFTINGTGTFAAGSGTVNFTGGNGVTQVITNGTQSFNNVTISGFGTVQMTGNTTINGNFLNTDGSLDMNIFNLTVGGNYANYNSASGLLPGTGTVIFNKASGTQTVEQLALDFNHIQHTGAGTLQLASDLSTTGDIINSAGTFDGNGKIITLKGNFNNTATFNAGNNGQIIFEKNGGNQTLTAGTSVFEKLIHQVPVGETSATLTLSGTVDVKGDVIIDAPIIPGTSTLKLSGTVNQTISGTESVIALNNMTVEKTGGTLTVSKPVNVDGTLTMTQGNIVNPTSVITLGSSSTDPGTLSYTSGTITGALRRYFDSIPTPGSGYYFPVGNSSNTRGSTIDFTSSPGTNQYLTVRYQPGTAMGPTPLYNGLPLTTGDGILIQNYEDEGFWEINPTGDNYESPINTAPYTITLQMKNLSTVNDLSTVRIIKAAGNNNSAQHHITWSSLTFGSNPVTGNSNADFTVTGTSTGFSWFGAASGNNNPLPVELVSFSGLCEESNINLTWQTASEFNSSHFDVEKSRDGENWQLLATVPSAGTSNELLTYQAVDQNGTDGNNYYRLRQVDIDGTEKLYDPINVSCAEVTPGYFTSFPNPSGSSFQVIVNNKELNGTCLLNIVDATGKVIEQREIEMNDGINMFVINQELTPGIYFMNISNGTKSTSVLRHAVK